VVLIQVYVMGALFLSLFSWHWFGSLKAR